MAFVEFMATGTGRTVRIGAGLALLAGGALLGGAWWIMSALGALAVVMSTRGDVPGCRCRG